MADHKITESWPYILPLGQYIKTEDIKIEMETEKYEPEYIETSIKTEIDIKTETYEQERNEQAEIKVEEREQQILVKTDKTPDLETKNCGALPESASNVEHNVPKPNSSQVTWSCCLCDFEFIDKDDLREHITSTHKDSSDMFKCSNCNYKTEYLHKLVAHEVRHKSIAEMQSEESDTCPVNVEKNADVETRDLECCVCDFKSKDKTNLREHITSTHKDPSDFNKFKCSDCDFTTEYFHKLVLHISDHKSPDLTSWYCCDTCSYRSRHKNSLKQHVWKHKSTSKGILFKCSKCSFQTVVHSMLVRHLLIHKNPLDIKWHKCDICNYKTKYKSHVKLHMLKHDFPEAQVYECKKCDFQTKRKGAMNKHMTRHD